MLVYTYYSKITCQISLKRLTKKHSHQALKYLIYISSICGPLLTLPQIYYIWIHKSAEGVVILSWLGYLLIAVVWTVYGIVYKQKLVTLSSALWIVVEAVVILEAMMYRGNL
jgi:uncharacterized protein with PQ loop repeat